MVPFVPGEPDPKAEGAPSDLLRIAITFRRPQDGLGPTKAAVPLSTSSVMSFRPEAHSMNAALHELNRRGFATSARGPMTASVRGSRQEFERVFGTELAPFRLDRNQRRQFHSVYYPPDGARWSPDPQMAALIDDAYIQWPHLYFAGARAARPTPRGRPAAAPTAAVRNKLSAVPPSPDYWHLKVPTDVARLLNATPVHRAGTTGAGVRVAMIDTGFFHKHPFFRAHRYRSSIVFAPGATNGRTDPGSHGTGESANVFATAPGVTFIGVKLGNDADPHAGASLLEGFREALKHRPHVISVGVGYDLRAADQRPPLAPLPKGLRALEAEIHAAIASGIVVVVPAGNGQYSFPGQMPDVISAGGVFVDRDGSMRASDSASAYPSLIYPGRQVPDFCGLVGMMPYANYIVLPVPPGARIDKVASPLDGTTDDDAWAVFSGTSAAAPQLAGVCALLLSKNPSLTPSDIKAILKRTARSVRKGRASKLSDPERKGWRALDGATGAGLSTLMQPGCRRERTGR